MSEFAPVLLERPLKLFGSTFKVNISTGLTLSPDTLLQITLDTSLLKLLRNHEARPLPALNAFRRAAVAGSKPRAGMRKLIVQKMGSFFPSETLAELLNGQEPTTVMPWQSDWEALQHGLGEPGEDDLYQLVARMARLDRVAWSIRQLANDGLLTDATMLLDKHIGKLHERWAQHNPNLGLQVAMLVDVGLQNLAWLEWRSLSKDIPSTSAMPASRFLPLLEPGKKPLGHWLLKLQNVAGSSNLKEFGDLMLQKKIARLGFYVSHDLLKKWSSGAQLMPVEARECVLRAVGRAVEPDKERGWFATARFLSFLCDLVIAGTRDTPPSWAAAQSQLHRRYQEIYELEAVPRWG